MTGKINNTKRLQSRLDLLKQQEQIQMEELKESSSDIVTSLAPANIIKSALNGLSSDSATGNAALSTGAGIVAGFIGEKLYAGKSSKFLLKLTAPFLQYAITNLVRKKVGKAKIIEK